MKVSKYKAVFGWDGDNGVGEMLVKQIIAGKKTATCGFKIQYTEPELKEEYETKNKIVTVMDEKQCPRCNIRILDVFETTFGNPDPRLVFGEGDNQDVKKFQADHKIAWENTIKDKPLTNDVILIVSLFELVEVKKG